MKHEEMIERVKKLDELKDRIGFLNKIYRIAPTYIVIGEEGVAPGKRTEVEIEESHKGLIRSNAAEHIVIAEKAIRELETDVTLPQLKKLVTKEATEQGGIAVKLQGGAHFSGSGQGGYGGGDTFVVGVKAFNIPECAKNVKCTYDIEE
jgi:hypothetical protein